MQLRLLSKVIASLASRKCSQDKNRNANFVHSHAMLEYKVTGSVLLQWNLDLTKCQGTYWENWFVKSRIRYIVVSFSYVLL